MVFLINTDTGSCHNTAPNVPGTQKETIILTAYHAVGLKEATVKRPLKYANYCRTSHEGGGGGQPCRYEPPPIFNIVPCDL